MGRARTLTRPVTIPRKRRCSTSPIALVRRMGFPPLAQPAQRRISALNFPTALRSLEVNSKTPTIYNFSMGFQQDIGYKTIIEATYVGSFARHLGEQRNINGIPDTAKFVDCTIAALYRVPCHAEN